MSIFIRDKKFYTRLLAIGTPIAAQQLISRDFSVTTDHGKFFDKQGTLFMATLHPAALLRNPGSKPSAFGDFVALRDKINEVCDHTYPK